MPGDAAEADNTENRYQSYNWAMNSRRWFWIVLILLLLGGASGLAWRQLGPLTIVTAYPTRGPAVRAVYATGTAEPAVMLPIAARTTGRLMELKVDEGDPVRADQVLARIEDADLQRSVDELAARARFAKSQFERAQALFDRKLGSPLERDQANADWQAAEAALARARALQGFMILRAPADGQILQRDGEIGQLIPANQPIFYFAGREPLRVEAEVDEEDILLVHPGQRALVRAPALPGQILNGTVTDITPKGNPVTRSYRVRITLGNQVPLRIGMTAEVNIIVEQHDNALLAPATAVIEGHVWTVREERLQRQPVQTGISGGTRIEILGGLRDDDRLVVQPGTGLTPGRRVRAIPAPESTPPGAG